MSPTAGERLVGDLNAGLDRVKASVAGRTPRKILIIVGRRTGTLTDIIAVGPGSYLHDIATIAGGSNVLASTTLEYPRISMETVISLAPDVIVDVGEMGESPADSDRRRQSPKVCGGARPWSKRYGTEASTPFTTRRLSFRARGSSRWRERWRGGSTESSRDDTARAQGAQRRMACGERYPVLEHVSFDVAPGEFVAVMGRNGAGKSTLLDIVAGLRAPTEGAVMLADRALDEMTALERARIAGASAAKPSRRSLDARRGAGPDGTLRPCGPLVRVGRGSPDRREAMQRCECLEFRRRTLATLSGGERQRVFLAACLAQRAPVLLLDEPATFLDVDQQLQCFNVLRAEADRGVACVAVTHDVNLALTFCTRLIVLAERSVARDLPAETALDDPAWLRAFSGRLIVEQGRLASWVRYQ